MFKQKYLLLFNKILFGLVPVFFIFLFILIR
jgi:hypothetical protein